MIKNVIGKYLQSGRAWYERDVSTITKITVHHTASRQVDDDGTAMQTAYNHHVKNGWPGLSYHFFIPKSGNIYQVNDYKWVTWHDGANWDSIAVCLDGYFHEPYNEQPNIEQLRSLRWLLDHLCTQHPEFPADQNDVLGHRDRMATACPGQYLYPKVKEYRDSNGNVTWGSPEILPPSEDCNEIKEHNTALQSEVDRLVKQISEKDAKISKITGELNTITDGYNKQKEQLQQFSNLQATLTDLQTQNEQLTAKLKEFADNADGLITQTEHTSEMEKLEKKLKTQFSREVEKKVADKLNSTPATELLTLLFRKVIKYE